MSESEEPHSSSLSSDASELPNSPSQTSKRKKKPYKELTLEEKVQLIRLAEQNVGLSQAAIAERYAIAKSNVCRILQRKREYIRAFETSSFAGSRKRKLKTGLVQQNSECESQACDATLFYTMPNQENTLLCSCCNTSFPCLSSLSDHMNNMQEKVSTWPSSEPNGNSLVQINSMQLRNLAGNYNQLLNKQDRNLKISHTPGITQISPKNSTVLNPATSPLIDVENLDTSTQTSTSDRSSVASCDARASAFHPVLRIEPRSDQLYCHFGSPNDAFQSSPNSSNASTSRHCHECALFAARASQAEHQLSVLRALMQLCKENTIQEKVRADFAETKNQLLSQQCLEITQILQLTKLKAREVINNVDMPDTAKAALSIILA